MTFDLNKRAYGEWFAPFEYELIFIRKEAHIGWADITSNSTFKLKYSPFWGDHRKCEYIVTDPKQLPRQNQCIEVKPLETITEPHFNNKSLYGIYQKYCIVDSYDEYKIHMPKINVGYKDFIYLSSLNWTFAEEDDLDRLLGLQLVSCPQSFYGTGGIGTIAGKLTGFGKLSSKIIPDLNSTYNNIIATNFQKPNDKYYFEMIKKKNNINQIRQQHSCAEINYCKPCTAIQEAIATPAEILIQIPLLIKGAEYKKDDGLAEPYYVLQYQLTALMQEPCFDDTNSAMHKFETNIKSVIDESNGVLKMDSNTINKLALGLSRLHLKPLKDQEIKEATDMFFMHLNNWKPYLTQSQETSNFRKHMTPLDIQVRFSHDHQMFLVELQKAQDETGEKWVDWQELERRFDKKKWGLMKEIVTDLKNLGMVIEQNNFSKIRKLD